MKKSLFISTLIIYFLGGCVSVDIKTELPEINYYDITLQPQPSSEVFKKTFGVAFSASQPYDSVDIYKMDSENKSIKTLNAQKWAARPKDMLSNSFSVLLQKRGIGAIKAPFGSAKISKIIKIHIERLMILQKDSKQFASISLSYDVLDSKGLEVLTSGSLSDERKINSKNFAQEFESLSVEMLEKIATQSAKF